MPEDKRPEQKSTESSPVANAFFEELERKIKDREHPPLNKLKDAINYALARKETLLHWLDDPAVPLDNNQVERAIRPLTVGRKNCLFIGAPEAGESSAILYTMVEECKRVGGKSPGMAGGGPSHTAYLPGIQRVSESLAWQSAVT